MSCAGNLDGWARTFEATLRYMDRNLRGIDREETAGSYNHVDGNLQERFDIWSRSEPHRRAGIHALRSTFMHYLKDTPRTACRSLSRRDDCTGTMQDADKLRDCP